MADKVEGYLGVGLNEQNEIVVNHPDLKPDSDGVGRIVFSAAQARNLADLLIKHARQSETEARRKFESQQYEKAAAIPVDYDARELLDGSAPTPDHREIDPTTGMQRSYVVLSAAERAKGFVRPVRRSYKHTPCGSITTMGVALAETYARCPTFYSGTMCVHCKTHFPLDQFVWEGTADVLGA